MVDAQSPVAPGKPLEALALWCYQARRPSAAKAGEDASRQGGCYLGNRNSAPMCSACLFSSWRRTVRTQLWIKKGWSEAEFRMQDTLESRKPPPYVTPGSHWSSHCEHRRSQRSPSWESSPSDQMIKKVYKQPPDWLGKSSDLGPGLCGGASALSRSCD